MGFRQPGVAAGARQERRGRAHLQDRRTLGERDFDLHGQTADLRATQPAAPLRRKQPYPGVDATDVSRHQAHLRRRYGPRSQVHPGAAGPGGSAVSDTKPRAAIVGCAVGIALVLAATIAVAAMVHGAKARLEEPAAQQAVAVADDAEVAYCTPAFKQVLQRVINACGLAGGTEQRGCQPADVKTFASINDADFNALFTPLKDRGAVILFDENSDVLDNGAKALLE